MPFSPQIRNEQQRAVFNAIASSSLEDWEKEDLWSSINDEEKLKSSLNLYRRAIPREGIQGIWQNRKSGPWEIGEPEPEAPVEEPGFFDRLFSGEFGKGFEKDIPTGPTAADEAGGFAGLGRLFEKGGESVYPIPHEQAMRRGKGVVEAIAGTPEEPTFIGETFREGAKDISDPSRMFSRDYWLGTTPEKEAQAYEAATRRPFTGPLGEKIQTPFEAVTTPMIRPGKLAPGTGELQGALEEVGEFSSPAMMMMGSGIAAGVRGSTAALAPLAPRVARWIPAATGLGFFTGMEIGAGEYIEASKEAERAGDMESARILRGRAVALGLGGVAAGMAGLLGTPRRANRTSAKPVAETIPMDRQLGASYAPPEPAPAPAAQPQPQPTAKGPIAALRPAGMELPAPPTEPLTARQKWERRIRGTETGALETTLPERTIGRGKKKTTVPGGRVFMVGEKLQPGQRSYVDKPPLRVELGDMGAIVKQVKAEEAEFQAREAMVRSQAERALKLMPEMGTMAGRRGVGPIRGLLPPGTAIQMPGEVATPEPAPEPAPEPVGPMAPQKWLESVAAEERRLGIEPSKSVPRETSVEPLTGEKPILPSDLAKPGQGRPPVYGRASHSKVGPHKILGSFAVVPNSELVTSHGAYLAENPYYPQQYQNRQRSSKESDLGIEEIRTRLDPEQLADSYLAKDGAPFILPDKVVLAGNGRSLALRRAYAEKEPGAQRYRQWLIDNAERFNLDRAAIESMEDPQLVRVYEPANTLDPGEFARIANVDETVQLSPSELASSDATRLTTGILDRFDSEAGAGILAESNRDFTRSFLEKIVQPSELPNFTHEGKINQRGVERVRNAIFAKAYGDAAALEKVTQIPGEDTAVLSQALLRAAPSMVKTQTGIAKGDLFDAPIHKEAARVTGLLANLSERGVDFEHYANQETLFKTGNELTPVETAMGRFMAENSRSPEKIATLLRQYNEALAAAGSPKQTGMFAMNPPTQADLLEAALRRVEAEYGTKASQRRERAARKKTSGADGEGKTGELGAIKEQLGIEGPSPGFTRLYRGRPIATGKSNVPQWAKEEIAPVAGRWFTGDKDAARWYIRPEQIGGLKGELVFVDVPTKDVDTFRVSNAAKEVQAFSRDPQNEFLIPRELADSATSVKEQLGAQLARDTGAGERATEVAPRKRRLRDFTISNPTEGQLVEGADAVYQPGRKGKPGTLYVNPAGAKLIAEVILRLPSQERYGSYATPDVTLDTLRRLRGYINKVSKEGVFDNSAIDGLKAVYAQLDAAHKSNGGPVVVATIGTVSGARATPGQIKRTILHERAHMAMEELKAKLWDADLVDAYEFYGAGVGKEQSWEQFLAHNAAQNIMKKFGYGVRRGASISEVTDEIVADLYANDLKRLGLTQNQADELFMHFLDLLVKDVGPDAADVVALIPNRLRSTYEEKYARKATAEVGNIRPESQWLAGPSRFVSRLREGWARSGLEAPAPAKLPAEELREARGGPDGSIDNLGEVLEGLKRFADRVKGKKTGRENHRDSFVMPEVIPPPRISFALALRLKTGSPSSAYPGAAPEFVPRRNPQGEEYQLPIRRMLRSAINDTIRASQEEAFRWSRDKAHAVLAFKQAGKENRDLLIDLLNDPNLDLLNDPEVFTKQYAVGEYKSVPRKVQDSAIRLRQQTEDIRQRLITAMRSMGRDISDDWGITQGYFPQVYGGNYYMVDKRSGNIIVPDRRRGGFYPDEDAAREAGALALETIEGLGSDDIEFKMFNEKVGPARTMMTREQFYRFRAALADQSFDWDTINEVVGKVAAYKRGDRQSGFVKKREKNIPGAIMDIGPYMLYLRAVNRYLAMAPLRGTLENVRVELATSAKRGEVPEELAKQWDFYVDAVEGRQDELTGFVNKWWQQKHGWGPVKFRGGPFAVQRFTGFFNGMEAALKLGGIPFMPTVSALVNLTQIPLNVYPVLGEKYTAKGFQALIDPRMKGLRNRVIEELGLREMTSKTEAWEAQNIKELWQLFAPEGPRDYVNAFLNGASAASLYSFNKAEYMIRGTAALGAYQRARDQGYGHEYAIDKARRIVTRTAFELGMADRPRVLRVSEAYKPWALFKSFPIKQAEFVGQTATGGGDPGARFDSRNSEFVRWLIAMGVLGTVGLPLTDTLDDVTEWLTKSEAEPGIMPVYDFKQALPRVSRGLPGVAFDVDITHMTGFSDWLRPSQVKLMWLGWPMGKDVSNFYNIMTGPEGRNKQRAWMTFWKQASPQFRRLYQAYEAHITPEHKITDTNGAVIIQNVTPWEQAMVAFGATPIRLASRFEAYEIGKRFNDIGRSVRGYYLDYGADAMERGDSDAVNWAIEQAANQEYRITVSDIRHRKDWRNVDRLERLEKSTPKGPQREELRRRREALDQ